MTVNQPIWNFEQEPLPEDCDETTINLRAYFDRMPDEKMRQYRPEWTDEELTEWDGNFKDDGALMLICSERDVDAAEYRAVLEECLQYRDRIKNSQ
jgi:hypothetical protein